MRLFTMLVKVDVMLKNASETKFTPLERSHKGKYICFWKFRDLGNSCTVRELKSFCLWVYWSHVDRHSQLNVLIREEGESLAGLSRNKCESHLNAPWTAAEMLIGASLQRERQVFQRLQV